MRYSRKLSKKRLFKDKKSLRLSIIDHKIVHKTIFIARADFKPFNIIRIKS